MNKYKYIDIVMIIQKTILDVDKFIYVLITVAATLWPRMLITRQFIKTHYLFDEATGVFTLHNKS